jgi:lysophospholipase L1-like esterase
MERCKMTNQELKNIYFGAYFFEETEDGYLQSFQYSKEQMKYFEGAFDFWYDRCMASTAKTLELTTEATNMSFDYKFIWTGSQDSFEVFVDGLAVDIRYVKDLKEEGTLNWTLPEGKKDIIVYLPADATVLIKNFEINAPCTRAEKKESVLWLGDSITQGYGPLRSAQTYVSVANRLLNYDIINQGIGGYIYDSKSLMKMEGYTPDKIIAALGTNQYGSETMEAVEEYYRVLTDIYGKQIPILCISPIWRGDNEEGLPKFYDFCDKVKKIAGSYPNVKVVDGLSLVPHLSEYYLDNLHPNCLGAETYGRNLVEAIRKSGF